MSEICQGRCEPIRGQLSVSTDQSEVRGGVVWWPMFHHQSQWDFWPWDFFGFGSWGTGQVDLGLGLDNKSGFCNRGLIKIMRIMDSHDFL